MITPHETLQHSSTTISNHNIRVPITHSASNGSAIHENHQDAAVVTSQVLEAPCHPAENLLVASRKAINYVLPDNSLRFLQRRKQFSGE